jgi:hypothetical protein
MDLPVTPQKRFREVGVDVEDANLNILMIPLNHTMDRDTGLEYYLYYRMSQEKLFPSDCVVYLESKHEGWRGIEAPFDMVEGRDYVYEEDVSRKYRSVTFILTLLIMISGYKLARSSAVRSKTLQHKLFWLVARTMGIHGPEFAQDQERDIAELQKGRPPNLSLWRHWTIRRAIAGEAYSVLLSILYFKKRDKTGKRKTYSDREVIMEQIQALLKRKNEAVETGNESIRDLKNIQRKLVEEALLATELADRLRDRGESEYALGMTDYLVRLSVHYDEFPRIESRVGEALGMLETLLEILRNPGDQTMESVVTVSYMIPMGRSKRGRGRVNLRAGKVEGPLATIPRRIQALVVEDWALDEHILGIILPLVEEMDKKLAEFMFAGKRMQEEERRVERLDGEALAINARLSKLKAQITEVKKAQRETQAIAMRARNSLKFLKSLGKDARPGASETPETPEKLASTEAFRDILRQSDELFELSEIPLDTPLSAWKRHARLIKTIEDLSRTYLHVIAQDDFTSEFLDLKKAERDLKKVERFDVSRPYDDFKNEFVEFWQGIVDTSIRDASNLQAVLTLAQRKGVKNVIMVVGSAHIDSTTGLIAANHGVLWTVKALPFSIMKKKSRESYYASIQSGIKKFTKARTYKGELTPTKRSPGTPFKPPRRRYDYDTGESIQEEEFGDEEVFVEHEEEEEEEKPLYF